MDKPKAARLLSKYNRGEATPEEVAIIEGWYSEQGFNNPLFAEEFDYETKRLKILAGINEKNREADPKPVVSKLWPRIAVIAAVVSAIVVGVWFFSGLRNLDAGQDFATVRYKNDIGPGTVGATLTLASGKKIRLSDAADGEIAKEAGISVTKTADGQLVYEVKENISDPNRINTLRTAKGETYVLTLPDKSKVWLNAASSLTYAANLVKNGQRRVKLTGEAYLEVAKDKSHPFVVESKGQEVKVLGTHFNINSYDNEPSVATTLIEGSVEVTRGNLKQILKPGEQAINNQKSLSVVEANINNITDWKNGDFFFERVDFRSVMRKIGRWYDVEVIYDPSVPKTITSNGLISRNNKLSTVLKSIEKSGQVHFKIEGKTVFVTK